MKTLVKNLRDIMYVLGILGALAVLVHLEENGRGRRAWETWKAAQEAAGQMYDLPAAPPGAVRDADNAAAAEVLVAGYRGWDPLAAAWGALAPIQLGDWPQGRPSDLSALKAQHPDLPAALAPFNPILDRVAAAVRRHACHFPEASSTGSEPPWLGGCSFLVTMTRVLGLRATARLQSGHPQGAVEDVETLLRISGHIHRQPALMASLMGTFPARYALQVTWEGLRSQAWTPGQLARLQKALESVDPMDGFRRGLEGERREIARVVRVVEQEPWHRQGWVLAEPLGAMLRMVPPPRGWWHQALAATDRNLARLQEAAASGPRILALGGKDLPPVPRPYRWAGGLGPRSGSLPLLRACATAQAGLDLARTACALERYRLARGAYPARLEDLGPAFLDRVPGDRLTDRPLGYVHQAGGYRLTGTGWPDGDEAGGQEKPETLAWVGGR